MPRSIVPATIVFICRLTIWQSRSRTGTRSGSNSIRRASPSAIAVFPDAGLAKQEDGIRALAMAQHFEDLVHLALAAEDGRHLVLPCQLVEVGREVLQKRRQLEALLQPLLVHLVVAHARREPA